MKKLKALGIFGFVLAAMLFFGSEAANAQGSRLDWEGSIDDRANLVIRGGGRVRVQTVSGQRNGNGVSDWNGRDDDGRRRRARVEKREGRGNVRIIQQPNRNNNFTTIIRIEDLKGGSDRYRVRVTWD